ncbi:hypothetical protein CPB86DRAFT_383209 [Serendipita vermifera]|nr:hypothetical protein CPB86DRAFT_383209 [Serendipita vermifera]
MSHKQQLPAPFKPPRAPHGNPTVPFPNESSIWEVYINESIVVDNELVKDWTSSLNFLLVFAAIFSSVLSAFIMESNGMLEQNPADVMVDALIFFINNTANGTHTPYSRASFSPAPYAVSVNYLFFASLSASIVAALASVVSLQWVAEYDAAVSRSGSSPEDRMKRREFRYRGMEKWKMQEIIATLPVLLYCSLFLFFVGLAQWMWSVHNMVGGVIIGGTLLVAVFYTITTMLAVVFPSSLYRAPIVRWLYVLFHPLLRPFTRPWRHPTSRSQENEEDGGKTMLKDKIRDTLFQAQRVISTITRFIIQLPARFTKFTVQERDQSYIGSEKKHLVGSSLAWVAQSISISNDSHRQLLLLAQESLKLDESQKTSKQFEEIRWHDIIHLLASEYVHQAGYRELKEEDERDLVILLRCLRGLRIGQSVEPGHRSVTAFDAGSEDLSDEEGVKPVELLFHDITTSEGDLSIEDQVKLRVGCLNQLHHLSKPTQEIRAIHKEIASKNTADIYAST